MSRSSADVVVIGAGAIGCAIARTLAGRGVDVIVVERDTPGRSATWAAAGMLSPLGEAAGSRAFLDLSAASLDMYAEFVSALQCETGIDVEYRTGGRLHVSLGDADAELAAIASGPDAERFAVRQLAAADVRALEPALSDRVTTGLLIRRDHSVNNRRLAQALHASAAAAGAKFRSMRPVASILSDAGAAAGVQLESGERIAAGRIVLAAGAWSGTIDGVPGPLPVRPIRGQMFSVAAPADRRVSHVIFERGCYIIPRADGRLLIGATVEDTGFREGPTPGGIGVLMASAERVLPGIEGTRLVETWSGFRPGTPDGLPILGMDPELPGLVHATGHFRNGILLAPITAELIAAIITGSPFPLPAESFSIARFR